MKDLEQLLSFYTYQNNLKFVMRTNAAPGTRQESSAEHSWTVAMMCWTLAGLVEEDLGVRIDVLSAMKMALIHDIVEIEAGDVSAWDTRAREVIINKEHEAIQTVRSMLPSKINDEVYELWMEHDKRESVESKLVKACDQLCPLVYRVTFNSGYAGTGVNRVKLDEHFLPVVSFSGVTLEMYRRLADELESRGLMDVG